MPSKEAWIPLMSCAYKPQKPELPRVFSDRNVMRRKFSMLYLYYFLKYIYVYVWQYHKSGGAQFARLNPVFRLSVVEAQLISRTNASLEGN